MSLHDSLGASKSKPNPESLSKSHVSASLIPLMFLYIVRGNVKLTLLPVKCKSNPVFFVERFCPSNKLLSIFEQFKKRDGIDDRSAIPILVRHFAFYLCNNFWGQMPADERCDVIKSAFTGFFGQKLAGNRKQFGL
jgi:hypothetical protein